MAWHDAKQMCALRIDAAGASLWGADWPAGADESQEQWEAKCVEQAAARGGPAAGAAVQRAFDEFRALGLPSNTAGHPVKEWIDSMKRELKHEGVEFRGDPNH